MRTKKFAFEIYWPLAVALPDQKNCIFYLIFSANRSGPILGWIFMKSAKVPKYELKSRNLKLCESKRAQSSWIVDFKGDQLNTPFSLGLP